MIPTNAAHGPCCPGVPRPHGGQRPVHHVAAPAANAAEPLPDLGLGRPLDVARGRRRYSTPTGPTPSAAATEADPSFSGDEQGCSRTCHTAACTCWSATTTTPLGNPVRRGWMGAFYTAGLDPIFWCHHANIDRLWQVWLDADPAHKNPINESHWANPRFSFPNPAGGPALSWRISEVIDTPCWVTAMTP